jgi:hypothetical protein
MTAAAGMGMTREEVDVFLERLDKTISEFKKKCKQKPTPASVDGAPPPPSAAAVAPVDAAQLRGGSTAAGGD